MMPVMTRIYDPAGLRHPTLRECAYHAAWIATVTEAANDVEDLLVDVPPQDRVLPDFSTPWPWDFDSFVVALSVMTHARQAAMHSLENLMTNWLGEDPENWPVLHLSLIDPWQERPGIWSEETPEWIRILDAVANVPADPFGRRQSN